MFKDDVEALIRKAFFCNLALFKDNVGNLLLFTKINFHKPTTAKPSLFNNQSFLKFSIFGPPMFILGLLKLSNLAISTEEIHPYVQQDIGPLGPLPYSHPTSAAEHHKNSSND